MNVLILFTGSDIGGAERSLTRMALAAGKCGSRVRYRLATLSARGPWFRWADELGLRPAAFGENGEGGKVGFFAAVRAAIRYAKSMEADAIYVMGMRAAFCLRWLRAMYPGIRLVHGIRSNPASNSRFDAVFRFSEFACGRLVDLFVSNSRAAAETLEKRCRIHPGKIRVVHNGFEAPAFDPVPWERRSRRMVMIANVQARKGMLEMADAFSRFKRTLPGWRCFVLGKIIDRGFIQGEFARKGLLDFVEFAGFQEDVSKWLRDARLLVFPSLHGEGAPTSIMESLAHAVPVAAYSVDGIPELVRDGVDGTLVDNVGDVDAFAAAVEAIAADPERANAMGSAGRRRIGEFFTLEACVKKHEDAFLALMEEKYADAR